jgi:hypothetical protein
VDEFVTGYVGDTVDGLASGWRVRDGGCLCIDGDGPSLRETSGVGLSRNMRQGMWGRHLWWIESRPVAVG